MNQAEIDKMWDGLERIGMDYYEKIMEYFKQFDDDQLREFIVSYPEEKGVDIFSSFWRKEAKNTISFRKVFKRAEEAMKDKSNFYASDDILVFQEGHNLIRVIGAPYQFWGHRLHNTIIKCSSPTYENCPLCEKFQNSEPRYLIEVLDRKSNSIKIMDIGDDLFQSIRYIRLKSGDLKTFDIDFMVNNNSLHNCLSLPTTPLSENELTMISDWKNKYSDLCWKYCMPPSYDEVWEQVKHLPEFVKQPCISCLEGI